MRRSDGVSGGPARRRVGVAFALTLLLAGCRAPTVPATAVPTATRDALGTLAIETTPGGAEVWLDGQAAGRAPLDLPVTAGSHEVVAQAPGFESASRSVEVADAQTVSVRLPLRDVAPPTISVQPMPAQVAPAAGLKVVASATDNVGVARMTLSVDGRLVSEAQEGNLRHNLDTSRLEAGGHELTIAAWDTADNVARTVLHIMLSMPAALPIPSATSSPTATLMPPSPAPTATRIATPEPTASPAVNRQLAVVARWTELTIATYDYERALYTNLAGSGHPYPLLHRDQVGSPRPVVYRALILDNGLLELTFLPDLGGRLYQCRFLPTGQTLFYNNAVIKPTHWGPTDQGWWLAVGGMEWCLPVDEHGYLTAQPWECQVAREADGGAVAVLSTETADGIRATVRVALRPGSAALAITTELTNVSAQGIDLQYWMNAMLAPGSGTVGPGLRFYWPADTMIVHSRGNDALPDAHGRVTWPLQSGRDLSRYDAWQGLEWLGLFATELRQPYTAVYDLDADLGMVRTFPPDTARGAKLFAFAPDSGLSGEYTDDGSGYVEMWGGLPATFWDADNAHIAAGAIITWQETWYPVSGCRDIVAANAAYCLGIAQDGEQLAVRLFAPKAGQGAIRVVSSNGMLLEQPYSLSAGQAADWSVPLAGNTVADLSVLVVEGGAPALEWAAR